MLTMVLWLGVLLQPCVLLRSCVLLRPCGLLLLFPLMCCMLLYISPLGTGFIIWIWVIWFWFRWRWGTLLKHHSKHCKSPAKIEFYLPVTIVIIPDVLVTNLITKLYKSCLVVMASQTMLAGMKYSITGTPNSHNWVNTQFSQNVR